MKLRYWITGDGRVLFSLYSTLPDITIFCSIYIYIKSKKEEAYSTQNIFLYATITRKGEMKTNLKRSVIHIFDKGFLSNMKIA